MVDKQFFGHIVRQQVHVWKRIFVMLLLAYTMPSSHLWRLWLPLTVQPATIGGPNLLEAELGTGLVGGRVDGPEINKHALLLTTYGVYGYLKLGMMNGNVGLRKLLLKRLKIQMRHAA